MSLCGHMFSILCSILFEIAVSYAKPMFSPLNSILGISTPAAPFYIPLVVNQGSNFFQVLINPCYPPLVEVVVILVVG